MNIIPAKFVVCSLYWSCNHNQILLLIYIIQICKAVYEYINLSIFYIHVKEWYSIKKTYFLHQMFKGRAERYDLKSRFCFSFSFSSPLFLGGKRKGEKNNQSRDFKSYLSKWRPNCLSQSSWTLNCQSN